MLLATTGAALAQDTPELTAVAATTSLPADPKLMTASAAEILAASENASIGERYRLHIINQSSDKTWTIAPGEGVSLVGQLTIAPNSWRDFIVRKMPQMTVSIEAAGTGQCPEDYEAIPYANGADRCASSSSPSRTTDTQSSKLSTEAEQIDFLSQYVILKSNVSETEFHIVYHDNSSGLVAGPSDWNIRAVMRVDDVAAWAEGKTQIDSADFSWAEPLLSDRLRPSSQPTFYVNGPTTIVIFEPEQIVFLRSTTFP
jgi:hypothetical protein